MRSKRGFILLCGIVLLALGCAENEQPNVVSPSVPYDELVPPERQIRGTYHEDQIAGMTLEHRGRRSSEHFKAYVQLKDKNPNAAFDELKKSAIIVWSAHHRSEEWALLVFRLDGAGNASISEMIHLNELEIEMARDVAKHDRFVFRLDEAEKQNVRNAYEDTAKHHETQLEFWQGEKEAAEAAGQNPAHVFIKWTVELADDEEEEEGEN